MCGVSDSLLNWFQDYLSNRRQTVIIPGANSDWALGPLLFLVYINDIINDIGSNIRLFADDTSLYTIVNDPETSAELLSVDLKKN